MSSYSSRTNSYLECTHEVTPLTVTVFLAKFSPCSHQKIIVVHNFTSVKRVVYINYSTGFEMVGIISSRKHYYKCEQTVGQRVVQKNY